tara:strand:+ start:407 stop:637 length:231 start_codon:yes stop_codon:yes gene_type:complete
MLIPIRCFTCGAVVADKHEPFVENINLGKDPGKTLSDLGVTSYCCRRMLLSNSNTIDQILPYLESLSKKQLELSQD